MQLLICFHIRVEDDSGGINTLKIWKSYNVCPQDAVKSEAMNQYIKYTKGFIITPNPMVQKALIDDIINAMDGFGVAMFTYSTKWKNWIAILDLKTCVYCRKMHGKIFGENEIYMRNRQFMKIVGVKSKD